MQNNLLLNLEQEALQLLLRRHQLLLGQLHNATITKREFTGVGFYTYFHVDQVVSCEEDMHISGVGGKLNNSIQIGFLLFVKKGKLSCLEGFTYDDPWPDSIGSYEVFVHPSYAGSEG